MSQKLRYKLGQGDSVAQNKTAMTKMTKFIFKKNLRISSVLTDLTTNRYCDCFCIRYNVEFFVYYLDTGVRNYIDQAIDTLCLLSH